MLDQKYRVRVSRDPMLAGERQQVRSKNLLKYGLIAGGVVVLVLVILLVIGMTRRGQPTTTTETTAVELKLVVQRGEVEIKDPGATDFSEAIDVETLPPGTTVRTNEDAIASLELSSGSVVRLNENSRVDVDAAGADKLAVRLVGGEAWSTTVLQTPVELSTLEARVTASASSFNVSHGKDQSTVYAVDDAANVTALQLTDPKELASFELPEGSQTTVAAKDLPASEDDFDAKDIEDEVADSFWFRFNKELDAEFAARMRGETDTTDPTLKVTTPKDGAEVTDDSIEVKGTTEVSATVEVDGKKVENKLGEFTAKVALEDGENEIVVTATDAAGNEATVTLNVTRKKDKPAAVTLNASSEESGSITLGWSASEADNFASYRIERDGSTLKTISDQDTTSYKDAGLDEGTEYTYQVCVVDTDEQESCSSEVKATPKSSPNKPPTVSITNPGNGTSVQGGTTVSFSASGNDPEGTELTYTWDFGDGVSSTGGSTSHAYPAVGSPQTYTVTVTVSDRSGATATASVTITVTP